MSKIEDSLLSWPKWPSYGQKELEAVSRVLTSNQLFAAEEVKSFEREFADYIGTEDAIGLGNATQGLHLSLAALGIGFGDEVIVTSCSWISTASCILMQNAIPVFVDIESENLGIDPMKIESHITSKTKAIINAHMLGYPAHVDLLETIAKKYNLYLIDDASHAPGAKIDGRKIGTFGDLSVFSLHQRKAISAGEGGVITTNNSNLAEKLRRMRSFGDVELSYNYRMTEFSAALAKIGLANLDSDNNARRASAQILKDLFKSNEHIKIRICRDIDFGVYYAIALEHNLGNDFAKYVIPELLKLNVPVRQLFSPLYKHPHFNPEVTPARGIPWLNLDHKNHHNSFEYKELNLPITEEFCNGKIIELYVHTKTTPEHLLNFVKYFEFLIDKFLFLLRSK